MKYYKIVIEMHPAGAPENKFCWLVSNYNTSPKSAKELEQLYCEHNGMTVTRVALLGTKTADRILRDNRNQKVSCYACMDEIRQVMIKED